MDPLKIEASIDTPYILLDKDSNVFEISGKSYPEGTSEFYGPVLAWLDNYVTNPNPSTCFVFKMKYFNSSSYKPIYDIFRKLETIKNKGGQVKIEWHYKEGDTDMLESGEEYADLVKLDFSYHAF